LTVENQRLKYAQAYLKIGWAVLPCHWITEKGACSCRDSGCKSPGKHPLTKNGVNDATKDLSIVSEWLHRWPQANIGVATGAVSGILVLDVDKKSGGFDSLDKIISENGPIPDDILAVSGSGGRHYVFKYPGKCGRTTTHLWPGIDVRGDRGYVVVEPSNHISGGVYFWDAEASPLDGVLSYPDTPPWLIAKLSAKSPGAAKGPPADKVLSAQEFARIRSALFCIPDFEGYQQWVLTGMELESSGADAQAFALWCEWASQSEKFDLKEHRKKWKSFNGSGRGLGSLFRKAQQHGWIDPKPAGPQVPLVPPLSDHVDSLAKLRCSREDIEKLINGTVDFDQLTCDLPLKISAAGLPRPAVESLLKTIAKKASVPKSALLDVIRSNSLNTFEYRDANNGGRFKVPELPGTDARDGTKTTRPLSELGNARRLYDIYRDTIKYVYEIKSFLVWRDDCWTWDIDTACVRGCAAKLPAVIYREGGSYLRDAEAFAEWSRKSQKERTIKAAVSLFQDIEQVRMSVGLVDSDPFIVGANKGKHVVELKTGCFRPAKKDDFVTKSLAVDFLGESKKATRWLSFLSEIFEKDEELIDWLKRWCGYLLTGSVREQVFVFGYGLGSNGKSVFSSILQFILNDYSRAIPKEVFVANKKTAGSASPDLAALMGARLGVGSETEDGEALAESGIKQMTGGEKIPARKLYCDPFEFMPQFKLMIIGNHRPIIKGTDEGIWRRVRMVPFRKAFEKDEIDYELTAKLKLEAPHIVAWMVEGCLDWQVKGLSAIPAAIKDATESYRAEQDLVGDWISEKCTTGANEEATIGDLYASYKGWCLDNGVRPAISKSLGRKLGDRGFASKRSNGVTTWRGLRVNSQNPPPSPYEY